MGELKERFLSVYHDAVHRDGADMLLRWLEDSDFFVAPASTKFHGCHEGGLLQHSLNVYDCLKRGLANAGLQNSYTDEGVAFASKIFEVLNEVKDNFTDEYSFNIESVPAERAAVILCQKDNVLYDHNDKFIYSNQWIPLSAKCTIQEKLRLCSILDEKCSGGSIAHINLESNFPNTDMAWEMLNKIAQSGVIYFAFNTRINECKHHHGFVGTDHCPVCGEPVFDTYQRIVGYLVPSRAYSKDRFREFNTRQWYTYAEAMSE